MTRAVWRFARRMTVCDSCDRAIIAGELCLVHLGRVLTCQCYACATLNRAQADNRAPGLDAYVETA